MTVPLRQCVSLACLALCCLSLAPLAAQAQVVVPGPLVPGRQGEARKEPILPQSTWEQSAPLVVSPMAPEKAAALMVLLSEVRIEGTSVIEASAFDDLWKPLVGQKISVARLFDVASAITQRYAQEGYALSFAIVPEQKIGSDGRVTIYVVEGFVDQIVYSGDKPHSLLSYTSPDISQDPVVEETASKILTSQPLRAKDLERYTLLLNQQPGVKVTTRFSPSSITPNASTLTVDIVRKPVEAEAFADNRQSKNMKRWEIGGSTSFNGLLYGADRLKLSGVCSKEGCDNAYDFTAQWSSILSPEGLVVTTLFGANGSEPSEGDMSLLDFSGQGQTFSVMFDYPLLLNRQQRLFAGFGFDASDAQTKTFAGTLTQDKVRTVDAHANYDFSDRFKGSSLLMVRLIKGVPFLDATDYNDPLKSRSFGSANFINATFHASRIQSLALLDPSTADFSLYLGLDGQAALSRALLSASQCSYGGASIGRGYEGGVISGDHCLQGIAELRYDWQLNDIPFQAYAFGDAGRAWIKGTLLDDEARSSHASSAGLGLRVLEDYFVSGDLQLAFPLRSTYAETHSAAPRVFLAVKARY